MISKPERCNAHFDYPFWENNKATNKQRAAFIDEMLQVYDNIISAKIMPLSNTK